MSKITQSTETVSQKVTAILIGASLAAYAVVFAVKGLGAYVA